MSYKIRKVVDAEQVPDWERRPPKWNELIDAVLALEPEQSLEVEFEDASEAENARNAVRDRVNLIAKASICRTRLVEHDDSDGATLYLTRVLPVES